MQEPSWRRTKLSLERPYKDDNGLPLPVLLDITPSGEHIYEPREDWTQELGQRFRQIFVERGVDFFETSGQAEPQAEPHDSDSETFPQTDNDSTQDESASKNDSADVDVPLQSGDGKFKHMTPEDLFKMRCEILPRLHIALGEMSHARDMLSLLLSTTTPQNPSPIPALPSGLLTASSVSKEPDIPSVLTFNALLVTGGKDDALRKAASLLKDAADRLDRSALRNDKYWLDALTIRKANWGLLPAPLPLGSATSKGSDKTARDFVVSYGLEQSSPVFRRRAIANLSHFRTNDNEPLEFPGRNRMKLRVSLRRKRDAGETVSSQSDHSAGSSRDTLHDQLSCAQRELVEQEIFDELIKEASYLPTMSARVSERQIAVEAAQGVELHLDMVDSSLTDDRPPTSTDTDSAFCDLVYASLHVLLLRAHAYRKKTRLKLTGASRLAEPKTLVASTAMILQPIIDIVQYHVFCDRVRRVLKDTSAGLAKIGVDSALRFDVIGESGHDILMLLAEDANTRSRIGGEAVLRIDGRHSVRFTFASPASLTAHLPHATINLVSLPQLAQLLADEIERCLLETICDIGNEICESISGAWFVDEMTCRSVGRWDGCVLYFRVKCTSDFEVDCHANRWFRKEANSNSTLLTYGTREHASQQLFDWVRHIIEGTLSL